MSVVEAKDYIEGLNRRHRQNWEMTRLLGRLFVKVETGKDWDVDFAWENEPGEERETPTEEVLNELRKKAKMMEERMNANKKQ